MKIPGGSIWFIPLTAWLAFSWPGTGTSVPETFPKSEALPQATSSPKGEKASPKGKPTPSPTPAPGAKNNAAKLVCQFLGVPLDKCEKTEQNQTKAEKEQLKFLAELAQQYQLEFLVATVPDPKISGLSYYFDQQLDALQRGIEAAGYILDRFDLSSLGKGKETAGQAIAETPKKEGNDQTERDPGVLLFRSRLSEIKNVAETKKKLLAVFLIGETPVAGLDKNALGKALKQVTELSAWPQKQGENISPLTYLPQAAPPTSEDAKLRVLGPFFSGSAASLALALRGWLEPFDKTLKPTVKAISGTALAVNKDEFLNLVGGSSDQATVSFQAMVVPNQIAREKFIAYLEKLDPSLLKNHKIAMLTEANTAYGRQSSLTGTQEKVTSLPFPLHIAQLRSAAAKASAAANAKPADKAAKGWFETAHQRLPLSLGESSETQDVVPSFSQLETASAELMMANLLEQIQGEQYRYIGILATDVRDRIFLAQEIRAHCPNTVIFTFNADLLYLHPEANLAMRGMLTVTTYPLHNPNQLWTSPFTGLETRLHFPGQISEGVYNAALALLGQPEKMLEYDSPFGEALSGRPGEPALWVTMVGRNSFSPVTVLKYSDPNDYLFPPQTDSARTTLMLLPKKIELTEELSETARIALLLLSLCSLLPFVALILVPPRPLLKRARRSLARLARRWQRWPFASLRNLIHYWLRKTRLIHVPLLSRWFNDPLAPALRSQSQLFLLSCCANLLALYLLASSIYFLPAVAEKGWIGAPWNMRVSWEVRWWRWLMFGLIAGGLLLAAASRLGALWRALIESFRPEQHSLLLPALGAKPTVCAEETDRSAPRRVVDTIFTLCFRLLFPLFAFGLLCWFVWETVNRQPVEIVLFCLRAADWLNGLSPLLPLFFVGLAGLLWTSSALRRLRLLDILFCPLPNRERPLLFLNFETPSFAGLRELEQQIRTLLTRRDEHLPLGYIVFFLIGFACCRLFWVRFIPTVEGRAFDVLFGFAFFMIWLALGIAFLRFVWVWQTLKRLLRQLSRHPLRGAYERLRVIQGSGTPDPGLPKIDLASPGSPFVTLTFSVDHAHRLWQKTELFSPDDGDVKRKIHELACEAEQNLIASQEAEARKNWCKTLRLWCCTQHDLAKLSHVVAGALETDWRQHAGTSPPTNASVAPAQGTETAEQEWRNQAECFLASRVVAFLHHIFAHLHNLAVFVTAGLLLMLLAVTSYPFQPRDLLLLFNWSIVLLVVGTMMVVFMQMNRDNILSMLSNTTQGKVTWDRQFISRIFIHVMLPILALLGAQFPEGVSWLLSWVNMG